MEDEKVNITTGMNYRNLSLSPDHYDDKEKRLSLAFVSEEPVRRDFGYEVIDQEKMDLSFVLI